MIKKLLLLFCCSYSMGYTYSQGIPSKGLLAHYDFNINHTKPSIISDKSKNTNDGTLFGQVNFVKDRFNQECSALFFDGFSYISVPDSKSLSKPKKEITIAVWFKINTGADLFKQWITICCKSDNTKEDINSPQYRMQATAQTISLNTAFTEYTVPQLAYDTWYFYALTYDGDKVKGYLNNKFFFEMKYSEPLKKNDMPLEIGRDLPGSTEYFYGVMDDLRIYDRALSESELLSLFLDKSDNTGMDRCQNTVSNNLSKSNTNLVTPAYASGAKLGPLLTSGPYEKLPETVDAEPVKYQHTVNVKSQSVTIYAYDNKKNDGDIVSININGEWLIEKYTLRPKSIPYPTEATINYKLNTGGDNFLISKAINEGKIPPNTMTLLIDDGYSQQSIIVDSKIGLSGGIRFVVR